MDLGNRAFALQGEPQMKAGGFTLIEMLVAIFIAGLLMAAVFASFTSQQRAFVRQDKVATMQQGVRASLDIMARDLRMAGYDPNNVGGGTFEIKKVGFRDLNDAPDVNGDGYLEFTLDLDEDGALDDDETLSYSLYDSGTNGSVDLARRVLDTAGNGSRICVAENIQALAFAYAYDQDGDGELDFLDTNLNGQRDAGEAVIWAIDTDNDNALDLNIDTNGDGAIDVNDDANGDGMLEGQALPTGTVTLDMVKSVKVWLLARTDRPIRDYSRSGAYVVGDEIISPSGDDTAYMYRLLNTTVRCRNL